MKNNCLKKIQFAAVQDRAAAIREVKRLKKLAEYYRQAKQDQIMVNLILQHIWYLVNEYNL